MFVDINDSTRMSISLPPEKFALVIQTFAQEIGIVLGYGGYEFKYEGDAIVILFPAVLSGLGSNGTNTIDT